MSVVETALKRPYTVVAVLILITLMGMAPRCACPSTSFRKSTFRWQYAEAQVTQGEQCVRLYKSLGGGWQDYQNIPAIRRPQPAVVAAFRRLVASSAPQ